jgi:hypothetical protein
MYCISTEVVVVVVVVVFPKTISSENHKNIYDEAQNFSGCCHNFSVSGVAVA